MSESVSLVAVDFESYYDAEYSLSKMSTFNYCHDPRFDAYLVAVHDKTGPVFIGHPGKFDWGYLKGKTVLAHNAAFDYQVYLRLVETGVIKNPPETEPWLCTADLAAYLGCKRDLATACRFLLGVEVSKAVRTAMRGRKGAELAEDPEVLKYGGRDAELCYMLAEAKLAEWPADERELSILNREACLSGVAVDLKKVETGRDVLKRRAEGLLEQIPWVATGHKPLSPNALKDYARACGIPAPASTAKTNPEFQDWVAKYGEGHPWVKVVGEYRSVNILQKRVESLYAGVDRQTGKFLYSMKYCGANTARFSAGSGDTGGKFNMQNMPRNEMFGVDLRPMFVASPGNKLVICDYAQVEARYLLWLVGDEASLAPLREGGNLYQTLAERMGLTTPGSDIKSTDKALYRYTKAFGLGAGYFMSGGKFKNVSKTQMGLDMTDEEAKAAIRKYRDANPKQVAYWYEHQDALALSARRRDPAHQVELKSGRVLTYTDPRHAWRIDPATQRRRKEIQVTQVLGLNRTWMHGGILTENEVQASCRDLLKDAWLACARAGYRPILSVHDELVFDLPKEKVAEAVPVIERLMTQSSPWAEGLPLAVETVVSDTYTK